MVNREVKKIAKEIILLEQMPAEDQNVIMARVMSSLRRKSHETKAQIAEYVAKSARRDQYASKVAGAAGFTSCFVGALSTITKIAGDDFLHFSDKTDGALIVFGGLGLGLISGWIGQRGKGKLESLNRVILK